jgi:hypothetical protein
MIHKMKLIYYYTLLITIIIVTISQNCYCQLTNTIVEQWWCKYQAPLKYPFNSNIKQISNPPTYFGYSTDEAQGKKVYYECGTDLGGYYSFLNFGVQNAYSADICLGEAGEHGGEVSIVVDPYNKNILWESHMSGLLTKYLKCNNSDTRGITWNAAEGPSSYSNGDPTSIVCQDGSWYISYLQSNARSIHLANYDQINGWQTPTLIQNPEYQCSFDRPFTAVDNTTTNGNFYCAWSSRVLQGSPEQCPDFGLQIVRSIDHGLTWDEGSQLISSDIDDKPTAHNGANIQIGPGGEVYVVWACYDLTTTIPPLNNLNEAGLVFARSFDQGVTYLGADKNTGYLIRSIHGTANYMIEHDWRPMSGNSALNSFPSMCVDKSYGPHHGRIYIVWANNGPINDPEYNGLNIYTYIIYSDYQGEPNSWSEPILINPPSSGIDGSCIRAFYPWISCDDETGVLSVIYYWTDTDTSPYDIYTYVAMSRDYGESWDNSRIGDYSFLGSNYFYGDYLGICSKQGLVYPVFSDSRNSHGEEECLPQVYISPFYAWNCVDHYPDEIDPYSVNQTIDPYYIRKWEAIHHIYSRNKIAANGVGVYNAGYEIKLLPCEDPYDPDAPEFWAHDGSFVHAYIEGCEPFEGNEPSLSRKFNKLAHATESKNINIIIDIYPNPTQGILFLKNNTVGNSNWNVDVENSLGISILSKNDIVTRSTSVDITKCPKGIYFVKIRVNENYVIKKIILN